MIEKILSSSIWVPSYLKSLLKKRYNDTIRPLHVLFCICDHFEPYWNGANKETARKRVNSWLDHYPKIAERNRDSTGRPFTYTFFYPEEEYTYEDMEAVAEICRAGFGEVEIHVHHDDDNAENFRKTLLDFKKRLRQEHGLLSIDRKNGEISYGFIHGNWALCNSRPDGKKCGVNSEISILKETGCFADFTMPSAPDVTQTKKINSIYHAFDNPGQPKSHDTGVNAVYNQGNRDGLLMVQGPLSLNWSKRKYGLIPKIENGGLIGNSPPTQDRVDMWIDQHIHIEGFPNAVFVKVYTHGTQEKNMKMLFDEDWLEKMIRYLMEWSKSKTDHFLHFVSAREMTNCIHSIMNGNSKITDETKEYRYVKT